MRENFDSEIFSDENGLDAFLTCQQEKFDLICTDHNMPMMNGGSFIKALRTKNSINGHTPVIFISGFIDMAKEDTDSLEKVLFMDKPMNPDQLVRFAKMMLSSK
jgi:CheY-like chemotaxis protein